MLWVVLASWSLGTALMIYFGCFYSQSFEDHDLQERAFARTANLRYAGFALVMVALVLSWFI